MTQDIYRRTPAGQHPPNLSPEYKSTPLRAPSQPPVALPHSLSEITGPLLATERLDALESDLTKQRLGEPLGERIAETIAFFDRCFAIKPGEADFRTGIAYNMLVPPHVRQAIAGWTTDPGETVAKLRTVRVPVLISQGRRDTVVMPNAAETAAGLIKGARISWYDQCGHSPFSEDAPRFNRELAAFVREVNG